MEVRGEQEPFIRLFERVVEQFPGNIAVEFNKQKLTYRQLNEQANRLAHALRQNSCLTSKKESIVAVKLAPSIEAIVAILAIMKAGMVYLPIPTDTDTSPERLQQITEETPPDFTIDDATIQKLLKHTNNQNLTVPILPTDLAYIAYSSGSTGKPKGIEIEHRGLCAPMKFHHDVVKFMPGDSGDCIAQFASLGFDASILEMMVGLGAGGRLCVVPQALRKNSRKLCAYYTEHKVTMAMFTPAMLYELSEGDLPTVRIIEPMGEALPADIVTKFQHKKLLDGYGPTEVSIASSVNGEPIYGLTFFVTKNNDDNTLYEEGEGELCIAGAGLARKYVNRPELNAKKFVELDDPRYPGKKIRVYKTGDRVELAQKKLVKIIGRVDRQVKIYGKLIQPEAIDEILQKNPVVTRAYTDIEFTVARHPKITAYLVLSAGYTKNDVDFLALYEAVKQSIGRTAAPTRFVFIEDLEKLPQTSQGKIDTKALKQKITEQKQIVNMIRPLVFKECDSSSEIENQLATIWKAVLDLPNEMKLALHDNFFHLGGTSILIMQLTRKICEGFEIKISVNRFEGNPTFSGMLRNIFRAKGGVKLMSSIVEISSQFSVPHRISERTSPVFFVHTLFSKCDEDYQKLSECWSSERPLYGIDPLGLRGNAFADESIEEAAQHYVEALLKIQSKGPYVLAGWSLGGTIAYEMARQLRQKHKQVSVLLIDSWSSAYLQNMSEAQFIEHLKKLHEKIRINFECTTSFNASGLAGKQKSQQIDVMCEALIATAPEVHHKRLWTIRCFLIALLEYRSQACDCDVRLIAANETVRECGERLCWPEGAVFNEVIMVDGDHHSIFSHPEQCRVLTEKVERMTQYQEAKLKLAPLTNEIAEKYRKIEDDFSDEQKQFYERLKLLNSSQKRKVSVIGDSSFCRKLMDKICFEWVYASQPRVFDFVLVIDGKRLSSESYNENVRFENIVHDACFGRDSFGQQLPPTVISQCFKMLQRSSVLVLVEQFDRITSEPCRNTILDVLNRDGVSVVFTATSLCKEWEELKMERVEQENYAPKAASPVNTNAGVMSTQGMFSAPTKLGAEIKGHENTASTATADDVMVVRAENSDAKMTNVSTEGAVVVFSHGGRAGIEGGKSKGSVHVQSLDPNMDARQRAEGNEILNGILGRIASRGKK